MNAFGWFGKFIRYAVRPFQGNKPPFEIEKVESALGYHFKDPFLLFRSLKHRSYSQARDGNIDLSNERMEFLGDSVLNMVISHYIFTENPSYQEGDLTKLKSILVSKTSAAIAARKVGLEKFILLSDSEEDAGGRERTSIVADTYEAIIGGIYLDGGLEPAKDFIYRTILPNQSVMLGDEQKNYKSILLELTQSEKLGHPTYQTILEEGPDHDKVFTVEVYVRGESFGIGKGKNKKTAQQLAAKEGLARIQKRKISV
jgi:ribonuclease III